MKIRLLLLNFLCFSVFIVLIEEPPFHLQKGNTGCVIINPVFAGTANANILRAISYNNRRVFAAPGNEIAATKSLLTIYSKKQDLFWNNIPFKDSELLNMKKLPAIRPLKTGLVTLINPGSCCTKVFTG